MKSILIGIDLGTTALKVAAFDELKGRMLYGVSKRLVVDTGTDGRRVQDSNAVLSALARAFSRLRQELGGLDNVCGIGVSAQGGSMIIADRNSGRALTPMTLWNDTRAFPEFHDLSKAKPPSYWRRFSLRDEPGMGLARLLRMRRESNTLLREENMYAGAGEFVYFHLTGQWRQDAGNALQIGCYDAVRQRLAAEPARLVDLPLSYFAPMRKAHATHPLTKLASSRFGLPKGVPVAGPYMDHEAGYMATSNASRRPLQCSLGTAWVGNLLLSRDSDAHSPFQLVVPSPLDEGRLVVQPLLTGNVTWDWALACFVDKNLKRAITKLLPLFSESLLPPRGLVALPWLNRPNPLCGEVMGGACLIGASPSTTTADMVRAVAVGMTHELARIFDDATRRRAFDSVVIGGGGSKGIYFQQLIAMQFAPIEVQLVNDEEWMGARGCLHAFNSRASRAECKQIVVKKGRVFDQLLQDRRVYVTACSALYGSCAAGRPLRFGNPRRKP